MYTRFKKHLSITTCLFFIVIGCAVKYHGTKGLDTDEVGEPHSSSTADVGLDASDDENLRKPGNTKDLEEDRLEQHNFGESGEINSGLSGYSNRALIRPTARKTAPNTYSQSAQDRDDDHDDDYDDHHHDDHDYDDYDDHHENDHGHDDDHHENDHDHNDDHHDNDNDDDHHDDNDHHHGQRNRTPVTVGTIPDQTVNVRANVTVNLGSYFSDPDRDRLTYTATVSDTTKATVSVSGSTLTITGVAAGTATITVTATAPGSLTATQTIAVMVNNPVGFSGEKQVSLRTDVSGDGVVDIVDVLLVAAQLGVSGMTNADINTDGIVDIQDLILVINDFSDVLSAPAADGTLTVAQVRHWLDLAEQKLSLPTQALVAVRESSYNRGLQVLKQMLRELLPQTTALLPNYPNPFNPETWIPYRLANASHVKISIYDASGHLVRLLALGHQAEGYYTSKNRAVYWDGRDSLGQTVGSGLYFYQLQADSESFVRKMLILK